MEGGKIRVREPQVPTSTEQPKKSSSAEGVVPHHQTHYDEKFSIPPVLYTGYTVMPRWASRAMIAIYCFFVSFSQRKKPPGRFSLFFCITSQLAAPSPECGGGTTCTFPKRSKVATSLSKITSFIRLMY